MIRRLAPSATTERATAATDGREQGQASAVTSYGVGLVTLAILGASVLTYALTFEVVRRHYAIFPPHYDSIGIYAGLFDLINQAQRGGLAAALPLAFSNGTSWLLPSYALLLSWVPVNAPEWLVSINLLLLLAAQAAIATFGRSFGFSPLRQIVAALIPLVPGALYAWDGGIQDLRRDVQLLLLALAILFLSLAYVQQPSIWRGLALGVLVGLAQWSRDNAAAVILIVSLPGVALACSRARRAGGVSSLVRLAAVPVGVFLVLALPYYGATLPQTVLRYQTSVWGIGESRAESLLAFWWIPGSVLFGGDSRLSGRVRVAMVTTGLVAFGLIALFVLKRLRVVVLTPSAFSEPPSSLLLASGGWVVLAVVLYNTLLLGYGARWHGVPFLPSYVGLVALMIGALGAVRRTSGSDGRLASIAVIVGCALLFASVPLRMVLNEQPPLGEAGINAIRAASFEIADRAAGRPVALLAYDTLSRHHAAYYLTQAGRPRLTEFEPVAIASGVPIDLDQPIRPDDDPAALRTRLDTALRGSADFALVYADTARYADQRESLWPYLLGQPVIQSLLADPGWRPVAHFTLRERDLVLLEHVTR